MRFPKELSTSRIVNGLARVDVGEDPDDDPPPVEPDPEPSGYVDPLDQPGPTPETVPRADYTKTEAAAIGSLLADVFGDEPLTRHVGGELQRIGEQGAWLRESGYSWRIIGSRLEVEPAFAARAVAAVAPELADPAVFDVQFQRAGRNGIDRQAIAHEVARLRRQGLSFAQIEPKVGVSAQTAWHYVGLIDPALRDVPTITRRNGRRAGVYGKLSDDKLRALHREHVEEGVPVRELARRRWRDWGYASRDSAASSIHHHWRRLGLSTGDGSARRCTAQTRWGPSKGKRCSRWALIGQDRCHMHADQATADAHAAAMRRRPGSLAFVA